MFDGLKSKWNHFSFRLKSNKDKFTEIYQQNGFTGDKYPASGIGASLKQTEIIRKQLPQIFKNLGIITVIDAPCGDFAWMSTIDLNGFDYHGFDIVDSVVENNRNQFAHDTIRFDALDIVSQVLPPADLILCRDCFVHLSNRDALKALSNFKKSGATYLLTTTFTNVDTNIDLVSGRGWRPLNLQKSPFNLPHPLLQIDEACTEADGQFSDKALGLWKIMELP